jgi:hypothetical protein
MVNWQRFHDGSLINDVIFKGPYTLISIDSIVCEEDTGLSSKHIPEDDKVFIFQVIWFIVFMTRINDWIRIVNGEVEELWEIGKELVDLLLRGTESLGTCVVRASWDGY